ncbi:hypothetical protein AHF37_06710 [Paragonimus kellicotti]|nr:hypothetical protein AHF37_06710 [Paragonimus kellicotti]
MEVNASLNGYKKSNLSGFSEKANVAAKRISLKALTSFNEASHHMSVFESAWPKLKRATVAVFQNAPVEYTLEELYRYVEDVCAQKMLVDLYSDLKLLMQDFVEGLLPIFIRYPFHLSFTDSMQLSSVACYWELYCKKMLLIRNIFLFMDRQLLTTNTQYLQLWDLALNLFRENVINHETVEKRILKQLFEEIHRERSGEAVDRNLLRSIIRMLIDLKLYQSVFLMEFIFQSQQFYAHEADSLLRVMNVPEYLAHVDKRIAEEEERLASYLEPISTRQILISTLVSELLTRTLDHLLDTGLVGSLKAKETGQLRLFYALLSRVPNGIDKLRSHFRQYVIQVGRDLVENRTQDPEKDRTMIQSLLNFRDYLSELIVTCLANDASFTRVLQEAYEEFINQRPNKPAEFLAKYLDSHLRSGNKAQTEEELDKLMDKTMMLFRYIDGKDIFEAFYTKELAKRLLLNKSASVDAEKAMLSKLKQGKYMSIFVVVALSVFMSATTIFYVYVYGVIRFLMSPVKRPVYQVLLSSYP